jgi:PDZ domain
VLIDVLAHDINVTYDRHVGQRLRLFNGEPVVNMQQLADAILRDKREPTSGYIELAFVRDEEHASDKYVAVLDRADVERSEAQIFSQYKVSTWCSPELSDEA